MLLTAILLSVIAARKWTATGSGSQGTGPVTYPGESITSGTEKGVPLMLLFVFKINFVYLKL